jgi:hypothetical protein
MTNTATKTYQVTVIERALAFYEVEAESPRDAAGNWSDSEFEGRDDEALETEGPSSVRERQPDGSWRKVPRSEWEDEPPAAGAASAHTPGDWYVDGRVDDETQVWIRTRSRPIASIPFVREPETDRANARLIAAGPKLLAEVVGISAVWSHAEGGSEVMDHLERRIYAIRDTIAEATTIND